MTKSTIPLSELAEQWADADLLKYMIQFVAQRMMELDVEALCGAGFGVKSEAGRIVSIAVIIAVAVNTDGVRKVLGMRVGPLGAPHGNPRR